MQVYVSSRSKVYYPSVTRHNKLYIVMNWLQAISDPYCQAVAVSVCLSAARLVPYRQRLRYSAKLAASRATSPTGLSYLFHGRDRPCVLRVMCRTPLASICCWFVVQQAARQIHNKTKQCDIPYVPLLRFVQHVQFSSVYFIPFKQLW